MIENGERQKKLDLSMVTKLSEIFGVSIEWIAEQDLNGKLPKLPEGLTPLSVKVLSSGYAIDNDTKTARYQIQCQLKYTKLEVKK